MAGQGPRRWRHRPRASGPHLLDRGVDGFLRSFHPHARWSPPVLTIERHPGNRDLFLAGRGLTLVPSYFCYDTPVALADPNLDPVLVYPVRHHRPAAARSPREPLDALLGRTRATILRGIAHGATTGQLSRLAGVSAATASHHITALRDAGLVTSSRHANTVLHILTPVGAALLENGR